MKRIDVVGQTFARLTVIANEPTRDGRSYIRCLCSCGNELVTMATSVRRGLTKSCGCLNAEHRGRGLRYKHGASNTVEYRLFRDMCNRCYLPSRNCYKNYGGRGIIVSPEWRHDFEQFLKDMGPRPSPLHSIDRIDNDGPYSKDNCRWATREEQANNMRSNRLLTWNGQTQTMAEWCKLYDKDYMRVQSRLNQGWTLEDALFILLPRQEDRTFQGCRRQSLL